MFKKIRSFFIIIICLSFFSALAAPALAEPFIIIQRVNDYADKKTTISAPDGIAAVDFAENSLAQPLAVKLMNILDHKSIGYQLNLPEKLLPQTDLYYFNFEPKIAAFNSQPQIRVKIKDSNYKSLYYYDWQQLQFVRASTTVDASSTEMVFDLPTGLTEIMFTVMGDRELSGNASWYVHPKYPGEFIAASTDFPFGAKLKVIAINSGKEVIVTVKDYGPDKTLHPDRVVDLSKEAFSVLAPTGAGVIPVKVIPIY